MVLFPLNKIWWQASIIRGAKKKERENELAFDYGRLKLLEINWNWLDFLLSSTHHAKLRIFNIVRPLECIRLSFLVEIINKADDILGSEAFRNPLDLSVQKLPRNCGTDCFIMQGWLMRTNLMFGYCSCSNLESPSSQFVKPKERTSTFFILMEAKSYLFQSK